MVESQVVTLRISNNTVSKLEEYIDPVGEIIGVDKPSIPRVVKFIFTAGLQHLNNPDPNKATVLEHLNNNDLNKKTLIEFGIEGAKTTKKNE